MSSRETVLVTGDLGYIGSVLIDMLLERYYHVSGYDTGYYQHCLIYPVYAAYPRIQRDIRGSQWR
jgi:nucleoside-diphosphate-sugar epimerase